MKKVKISLILNMLIVILVIVNTIFMFTGFKFMPEKMVLEVTKVEMFKFFTVDSNILVGIISLILIFYEIRLIKNKINRIPNNIYILKLIGVSAIFLTFIVTLLFLAPQFGFYAMYNNSNLFYHLFIPILTFISYMFYEPHEPKYKYAVYGMIPMFLYSVYYIFMVIFHLNDGGLTYKYDFYGFLKGNINNIYIVIPLIYFISYIISISMIFIKNKLRKELINEKQGGTIK